MSEPNDSMRDSDIAIETKDLDVTYRMVSHRHTTFKEYALNLFKKDKANRNEEGFQALKGVNLQIFKGESIALIGHNGSGKSTLLKTFAGIIPTESGQLVTRGRIAPMIELGAGFDYELSGLENIRLSCLLMGLSKTEIEDRLNSIVDFADLGDFIYAPLKSYSSGMAARIGFACATAVDPEILLIDEVLAVGDQNFTKKCLARIRDLQKRGTTIVLVSHDMGTIRRFCERAYVLNKGEIAYEGPVEGALLEHDQIMDRKLMSGMSNAMRAEIIRRRRMEQSQSDVHRPTAKVSLEVIQEDKVTSEPDVAKSFSFRFQIKIKDANFIEPRVAFGLALTKGEAVITGFNNLDLGFSGLEPPINKNELEFVAQFDLPSGLPELESGSYGVLFGIHDCDLSREIFFDRLSEILVNNSNRGINRHHYVFDVSHHVKNFEFIVLN